MINKIEKFLQDHILPELAQGRPDWDKSHTEAVVHYIKEIIKNHPEQNLDYLVLVIAAYAHDWGYIGLFEQGKQLSLDQILAKKKLHAELGAQKIEALMSDSVFAALSIAQKARVVHLVRVHDQLANLTAIDELTLMEADTLGALDIDRVTPSLKGASNLKYLEGVRKKRLPLFIHFEYQELAHKLMRKYQEQLGDDVV